MQNMDMAVAIAEESVASKRVLVVDDNADAADAIAMLLKLLGHVAEVVGDGHTALAYASTQTVDLILLDIGLPDMDGYEVARLLRSTLKSETRIVALTGYEADEVKLRSVAADLDGHIVKPLNLDVLQNLLAQCEVAASA